VRIIDKNSGPGQASRAMAVHARTLEFYRQMGFADVVVNLGIKIDTIHLREHGEDIAMLPLRDIGEGLSPYPFVLAFPQDDHERFLVEQLRAATYDVEWNTELESFTQDEWGVRAVLERDGERLPCSSAYLCGCDGARSRVRETLKLDFSGGTYDHLYYVADVQTAGPPNQRPDRAPGREHLRADAAGAFARHAATDRHHAAGGAFRCRLRCGAAGAGAAAGH
jgi:2-polyprenyl-6-methoxyphenol hydroxylase-like FAD-dependent oxidoreductase